MKKPNAAQLRRLAGVANGATINGTYRLPVGEALESFRADIRDLVAWARSPAP